jgi:hypothetical protein
MACTFTVSLDDLRQVGSKLSVISANLTALGEVRSDYAGVLGPDRVRHEVESFFNHWSDGMHRIGDHVKDLADHVSRTVDTYDATENALIAQATPSL